MPYKDMWEGFFSPAKILETLGFNQGIQNTVEFGCGYGTFTIPAARMINGLIYAFDIEPDMISITKNEAKKQGLSNVRTILRDFIAKGTGLPDESVDYVMLFNILHLEKPMVLLKEAKRILRVGGNLSIIHWNYDPSTPRGPSMDIRSKPDDCIKWAEDVGFRRLKQYDLKPYHYGIVATKVTAQS